MSSPLSSEAVTRGVRVRVEPRFAPERSNPSQGHWFFLYTVTIRNEGEEKVQLLTRHWIISDGAGATEEVEGPGVVGEQPVLVPGEEFEYTSGCPLPTDFGSMHGSYGMVNESGEQFEATIAPFTLATVDMVH